MGVLRQPPRCWPGTLGTERWVTLIFRSQKDRAVTVRGVSVAECSCSRGGKRVCRGGRTAGTLGLLPAERASADPTCTRPGATHTRCLSPPHAGAQCTASLHHPCPEPRGFWGQGGSNTRRGSFVLTAGGKLSLPTHVICNGASLALPRGCPVVIAGDGVTSKPPFYTLWCLCPHAGRTLVDVGGGRPLSILGTCE